MPESEIIIKVSEYVEQLFERSLPDHLPYHTIEHTRTVARTAAKIAKGMKLGEAGIEVVTLAAWFHDVGYIEKYKGHEDVSITYAHKFLKQENYPDEYISFVVGCIRATKIPQTPQNILEEVVADADLAGFGRKSFFARSEELHQEWKESLGTSYTEEEWMQQSLELLSAHRYFTPYAREKYSDRKAKNILKLYRMLRDIGESTESHEIGADAGTEVVQTPEQSGKISDEVINSRIEQGLKYHLSLDKNGYTLIISSTLALVGSLIAVEMNTFAHRNGALPFFGVIILLIGSFASLVAAVLVIRPTRRISLVPVDALEIEPHAKRELLVEQYYASELSSLKKKRLLHFGFRMFLMAILVASVFVVLPWLL
ncbi:MAG: HD domain-containing protein [bacterium]